MKRKDGFAPIRSYAAIGDGRTVALVASDGSVDFMSLPELHSPTTFAALLDPDCGGRFTLAPVEHFETARRYLDGANVLETTFRTASGVVRTTEALTLQDGGLLPWVELARRVEGLEGSVELAWRLEPRFDWGRSSPEIRRRGPVPTAEGDGVQLAVYAWDAGEPILHDDAIEASFMLEAGASALLALVATHDQPIPAPSRDDVETRLRATCRVWRRWLDGSDYGGPWRDAVARSALALKLLVFAPRGGITAAPTTSLPEVIGGDKNYDYRYVWVRDSAFTLDAFMRLGLPEQVHASFTWLLRAVRETAPHLRPFYDIGGGAPTRCDELPHLQGYRGSQPVRYGNAANVQLQLGTWGDLLETADLYVSRGNALDGSTGELLAECVDRLAVIWSDEDSGIWELEELHHYTSSKTSVWAAFDRAVKLAEHGHLPDAHVEQWLEQREHVHAWIEESCWSDRLGAYAAWAGGDGLDAALLRAVRLGYPERERLGQTLDVVRERLSARGPLLYRSSDHIGKEGAFVACSFWLVEALARLGRVDEARTAMEELLALANDVGLFSEQIDPGSGEFLGNFPQGLSHLALINAAGAVEDATRDERAAGASATARAAGR